MMDIPFDATVLPVALRVPSPGRVLPPTPVSQGEAGAARERRPARHLLDKWGDRVSREDFGTRRRVRLLQGGLRKAMPDSAQAKCGCRVGIGWNVAGDRGTVIAKDRNGRAFASGMVTCSSVWLCPYCSSVIARHRRDQVRGMVCEWIDERGGAVVMMTLTQGHSDELSLREQVRLMQATFRKTLGGRDREAWKAQGLAGGLTGREVTRGRQWHPHTHTLLFFAPGTDAVTVKGISEAILKKWVRLVRKAGLACDHAAQDWRYAYTSTKAGEYITKYGVEWEMSGSQTKKGRKSSRTFWQILEDFVMSESETDRSLIRHYAEAMKGTRQLTPWGDEIKALYRKHGEEADAEVLNRRDKEGSAVCALTADAVRQLQERGVWNEVLDAAEHGFYSVMAVMANNNVSGIYPPHVAERVNWAGVKLRQKQRKEESRDQS